MSLDRQDRQSWAVHGRVPRGPQTRINAFGDPMPKPYPERSERIWLERGFPRCARTRSNKFGRGTQPSTDLDYRSCLSKLVRVNKSDDHHWGIPSVGAPRRIVSAKRDNGSVNPRRGAREALRLTLSAGGCRNGTTSSQTRRLAQGIDQAPGGARRAPTGSLGGRPVMTVSTHPCGLRLVSTRRKASS